MVDADVSFSTDTLTSRQTVTADRDLFDIAVHDDGGGLEIYADASAGALFGPAQSPLWVQSWYRATGKAPVVATVSHGKKPLLALALGIERRGPFRVACFIGGSHANGNFPAIVPGGGNMRLQDAVQFLVAGIGRARPDIDLLALERQLPAVGGIGNPLAALPCRQSPNIALAADLEGGFEALLGRVNGKRKRKKHRSQVKKFEAAGGFHRIEARTAADVDRMLAAFFEMKARRFPQLGIADVFAPPIVRAAFADIFKSALAEKSPPFVLHGLEVGGRLRAVTGASRFNGTVVCDFCAFSDDELYAASPGDFLFFENIREACEQEMNIYDFSVGDERYKRAWSNRETAQFDVFLPLTAKGRIFSAGLSAISGAKRTVKNNPALLRAAMALRGMRR